VHAFASVVFPLPRWFRSDELDGQAERVLFHVAFRLPFFSSPFRYVSSLLQYSFIVSLLCSLGLDVCREFLVGDNFSYLPFFDFLPFTSALHTISLFDIFFISLRFCALTPRDPRSRFFSKDSFVGSSAMFNYSQKLSPCPQPASPFTMSFRLFVGRRLKTP